MTALNEAEAVLWFEELLQKAGSVRRNDVGWYDEGQATGWLATAEAALASVFPSAHPLLERFRGLRQYAEAQKIGIPSAVSLDSGRAIVESALTLLKQGRLRSLVDGVRAETVSEVLDQAELLLRTKHAVAAAVLAGGALETHLLHLCTRNGVMLAGERSIAKYDQAVAEARNKGTAGVYEAGYSRLIGSWGDIRNAAAHSPTKFDRSDEEVGRMVAGIREFIARVS